VFFFLDFPSLNRLIAALSSKGGGVARRKTTAVEIGGGGRGRGERCEAAAAVPRVEVRVVGAAAATGELQQPPGLKGGDGETDGEVVR
jgi:hypothetical protein